MLRPLALLSLLSSIASCSAPAQPPPASGTPAPQSTSSAAAGPTKIVSLDVSDQNLRVDKVGMHDGMLHPDGNLDLAFNAVIDGPVEAIFLVEVNAKGDPAYGYRADTIRGNEELPRELGGVIDVASMTLGIGVTEDNHWVNGETGGVTLGKGLHHLVLYAPNTGLMQPGDFIRLFVRVPGGAVQAGPVAKY